MNSILSTRFLIRFFLIAGLFYSTAQSDNADPAVRAMNAAPVSIEPAIKGSNNFLGASLADKKMVPDEAEIRAPADLPGFEEPIPAELEELDKRVSVKKDAEKAAEELAAAKEEEEERIEFQFENTDLKKVIEQIAQLFNVTIITDDIIDPPPVGAKNLKASISFRTHKPLTKKEAWNLFTRFLDIAQLTIIPDEKPAMFRVIPADNALTAAVPVYIGVDSEKLPDGDQIIRYVYFIANTDTTTIETVVKKIATKQAGVLVLIDLKALIITDKAYNIKVLMRIVKELDKVTMPQAMSVLKLRRASAKDVEDLYNNIVKVQEGAQPATPIFPGQRKQPTALYFPENARVIAEPRTNSLVILGTQDAIDKIETFVKKHIDKDADIPYSPLFHYDLKYADAETVAKILTDLAEFGKESTTNGQATYKYFKPIKFIADTASNRIIIRGDHKDYMAFKRVIEQIDRPQWQIAIEVLVLNVTLKDERALGAQLRKKEPSAWDSAIGCKTAFQTSGLGGQGILTRKDDATLGCQRLLGDLVNLVKGLNVGNTILTFGFDNCGVWGIFRALESISTAHIISNPFLVASNNQTAVVSVGERRRVVSSIVQSAGAPQTSYTEDDASLTVTITKPQINSDGKIVLDLDILLSTYIPGPPETVAKTEKRVTTKATLTDREVLAIGGLVQNRTDSSMSKLPILGDVPLLGWLFKNRDDGKTKENLLLLISAQIIDPLADETLDFTKNRIDEYHGMLQGMHDISEKRDPIHRFFFESAPDSVEKTAEEFIFKKPTKRKRKRKKRELLVQASAPEANTKIAQRPEYPDFAGALAQQEIDATTTAAVVPRKPRTRVSLIDVDEENEGGGAA